MRYWFITLLLATVFSACNNTVVTEEIPADLEGKRNFLKAKREELKNLTALITKVEAQVDSIDPTRAVEKGRLVTTKVLDKQNFKRFVEVQGLVEAEDLVDATGEIGGRIITLTVDEGDQVNKGQLIAKLDLEQLKKQKAELTKSLELATTVFERQQRLWNQNIGSEIQYLEAKNNKERLEKSIETLDYQLTKGEVFAPISGLVDRVVMQSGEVVAAGAPIIQILSTKKLKVKADVPETLLTAVKVGEEITVNFPAIDMEQKARINLIGRVINPSNRTFEIEANLSRYNPLLKPNLLATVLINDLTLEEVITVPVEAVLQEVGGKDYVFIRENGEEGKRISAKKVYISTGESYEGEIIVTQGLIGGEELILEGARDLTDGEQIRVAES